MEIYHQTEKEKMEKLNIKITEANKAEIEDALRAVNGKFVKHACTEFDGVLHRAACAEERLESIKLPKALRAGAVWTSTSGMPVANSYGSNRTGTRVTLLRKLNGWYLVKIEQVTIYKEGGGPGKLSLTREQHHEAAKRLMAGVTIIDDGE